MSVEITPYFALDERYPSLIGVRVDGDEYETAYVSKHELMGVVRERDELRELVRDLLHHIEYPPCEGCLLEMSCAGDLSQCDEYFDWLKPRARKLGVEVDG